MHDFNTGVHKQAPLFIHPSTLEMYKLMVPTPMTSAEDVIIGRRYLTASFFFRNLRCSINKLSTGPNTGS